MQGWIDPGLTRAGAGDAGGIATLLVHLGAALAARPEVEEVVDARARRRPRRSGWRPAPASSACRSAATDRWRARTRGRIGASSSAASSARSAGSARSTRSTCASPTWRASPRRGSASGSGLPYFFTLAPDPHALIRRRELAGELDRDGFVQADRREHLLFRARLVERLRDRRDRPRPAARARAHARSWPSSSASHDRHRLVRTVPEGIAIEALDAAAAAVGSGADPVAAAARDRRRRPAAARDAAFRSSSRSGGCTASRASRRCSRPGRATRRCATRRTWPSSAATSRSRAPRSARCSRRCTAPATAIPARATGCCCSGTGRTATSCA